MTSAKVPYPPLKSRVETNDIGYFKVLKLLSTK